MARRRAIGFYTKGHGSSAKHVPITAPTGTMPNPQVSDILSGNNELRLTPEEKEAIKILESLPGQLKAHNTIGIKCSLNYAYVTIRSFKYDESMIDGVYANDLLQLFNSMEKNNYRPIMIGPDYRRDGTLNIVFAKK